MTRKQLDLLLVAASSVVLTVVVLTTPAAEAARIILGLPFVLFFPGYVLMAALFPRKDQAGPIERIALSLGLSIAAVPLIGLALNYSPWGIRLNPILASLTIFIVLTAAVAVYRRGSLPPDEAWSAAIEIRLLRWSRVRLVDRLLSLGLALSLAGLGVALLFVATSRGGSGATEFYVLGPGGEADDYPSAIRVGEDAMVTLGVVNQEGEETTYRIEVIIDGESRDRIDGLVLAHGETWETEVALIPTHAGADQKAEFLLYRDGQGELYRGLHLWLDVEDAAGSPQEVPATTPATADTSAPTAPSMATDAGALRRGSGISGA